MDLTTLALGIEITKRLPGSAANIATEAKEAAEDAAERAETAADQVTPASVAETKAYLGIT